jgi:hypothetical protein
MGRRVGAWLVAAVVTTALVVGGVVVAGGRDREPAMLPPLDLDAAPTAAADAEGAAAAAEPARVGAATPARPYDTGDAPTLWPAVTYQLRGSLPDLPDRARAWRLGRDADRGRMAALAAALGLRGQLKQDQAGWTVSDGRSTLRVNRLAGLPWSYGTVVVGACVGGPWSPVGPAGDRGIQCLTKDTAAAKDPKAGVAGGGAEAGTTGSGAGSPASPGSARPVVPGRISRSLPRPADLPSRETAERIARELAAKAGLALDGAVVRVADGYAARVVTISPAVGGQPTHGVAWTVSVGPKGRVQYASGWLATPQPADTYPLMSEAEGLKRLRERSGFWPPILRPDVAARAREVPCPPVTRLPCSGKPLPKRTVTITGVRLGLQLTPAVADRTRPAEVAYLLPAYLFDLEGGWTDVQAVVAVQDRYLTPPPKTTQPQPVPADPDQPASSP